MFGLGFQEIALLSGIALLLFGPRFFEKILLNLRDGAYGFRESLKSGQEPVKLPERKAQAKG